MILQLALTLAGAVPATADLSAAGAPAPPAARQSQSVPRQSQSAPRQSQALLIRHVHVACPTQDVILKNQRVRIESGAIVAITGDGDEAAAAPDGAVVIDGKGRYLIPGFYDMHVHLPGVDSYYPASFREEALEMMLSAGITSARVARGSHELLTVAHDVESGATLGPRLFVAAPALRRDGFPDATAATQSFAIWKAQGFTAAKMLSGPPAQEHAPVAAAAVDAGLRWYGHGPDGAVPDWPLASLASVEHSSILDRMVRRSPDTLDRDLKLIADAGVYFCPDIDFYYALSDLVESDKLSGRPGMDRVPEDVLAKWKEQRRLPDPRRKQYSATVKRFEELAPQLRSAGVELLVSASDPPFCAPGLGYVAEAEHLVRAGYTPREVLRMATLNGARCQGEGAVRGAVQVGRMADLVLLEANPFEDVAAWSSVALVLKRGDVVWRR